MIIFLNGCSSAGKSTIAKAIQHLSAKPWLLIGVDTFFQMMPSDYVGFGDKADQGFQFIPERDELGPLMRIQNGPLGEAIVKTMPKVIRGLAEDKFDLIVDEVVFGDEGMKRYAQTLSGEKVYFVGVICDLPTLQEREILRGDRAIGLGRDQVNRAHAADRFYDLTVDTTTTSAFESAKKILKLIDENPSPQGFIRMREPF